MGIAASQGRQFLLTARSHDLTYRGNNISQQRLMLTNSTENISKNYARKTGNRQMTLTMKSKIGANATLQKNLTYHNMMEAGRGEYDQMNQLRIKDRDGNILVSKANSTDTDCSEYLRLMTGNSSAVWKADGTYKSSELGADGEMHDVIYKRDAYLWLDISEADNILQEGLRNGAYILEQQRANENGEQIWTNTSWASATDINDRLYTDDDQQAKAEYDAATSRIQQQDKRLEIEQKAIETEYKAVTTELESVAKLISTNVQNGFKMFNS